MNESEGKKSFEAYQESLDNGRGKKALEQNRLLYNEIFNDSLNSNGDKKVLEGGLDQLEKDATSILEFIKLNTQEVK